MCCTLYIIQFVEYHHYLRYFFLSLLTVNEQIAIILKLVGIRLCTYPSSFTADVSVSAPSFSQEIAVITNEANNTIIC